MPRHSAARMRRLLGNLCRRLFVESPDSVFGIFSPHLVLPVWQRFGFRRECFRWALDISNNLPGRRRKFNGGKCGLENYQEENFRKDFRTPNNRPFVGCPDNKAMNNSPCFRRAIIVVNAIVYSATFSATRSPTCAVE